MEKYNGIIIFGEMGSGKDTLADMISFYNKDIKKYGLGDIIRSMKPVLRVSPEWNGRERGFYQSVADKLREIDKNILNKYCLSKMFSDYTKEDLKEIKEETEYEDIIHNLKLINGEFLPMIVGGRTYDDYDYWKNIGFMVVGIKTDRNLRMERLIVRDGEEVARKSDPNHNTEKNVADIVEKSDYIVKNDGTLEDLKKEAEKLVESY
ncbi:hypothetical protein [Clostridium polynesiense]|uniref:hypothetical protein n=1 Tax=Clostridium polynesiense TaxID=1325933 RepID=UPI00058E817A|nr:hypothetical protein [Clostridium polynesiense]